MTARITNERAMDGESSYDVEFDLERDIQMSFAGPTGPAGMDATTSDLLDIALSVVFIERDLRKVALTNRVRLVEARLPVRDKAVWEPLGPTLEAIFSFMGGCRWRISFCSSRRPNLEAKTTSDRAKQMVVLHSGGLDSTCGLTTLLAQKRRVQLASFHTLQGSLQSKIAEQLGFDPPSSLFVRWKDRTSRRGRGAFAYRSFLFLSLGAAVARSFGATRLLQFENGFMAASIVPSTNYFATRHAHPKFHALFDTLMGGLGLNVAVENPFRWITKREAVELARSKPIPGIKGLLASTQTCWFYSYHQFPSRFKREKIPLAQHQHCGACVPCLVRRSALRDRDYSLDPRKPPAFLKDPRNVSCHYDAYAGFCGMVLDCQRRRGSLLHELLRHGILADEAGPWERVEAVITRFARDFVGAFGSAHARPK